MSEQLDAQAGAAFDQDHETEQLHRKEAAKMTRMFLFFAAPLIVMIAIVIAVFGIKMSQDSKAIVAKATPMPAVSAPATPNPAINDKDAQIAQLQSQIIALQGQLHPAEGTAIAPAQPYYAPDPSALAQLSARVDRVEAAQRELVKATAAAYAARSLQLAAKNQQPFLSELAAVEPALNDPVAATTLRPYAEKGVPSEVALAVTFPSVAARANIAAKADDGKDGLFDRIGHAISGFISVRRVGNPGGQGAEAILERAEIRLNSGDLKGAVAYLDTLPPSAQKALSPWLEEARARVLVDDTTRRVSETALSRLSQITSATQTPLTNGGVL